MLKQDLGRYVRNQRFRVRAGVGFMVECPPLESSIGITSMVNAQTPLEKTIAW
jgi:hypothetical protein